MQSFDVDALEAIIQRYEARIDEIRKDEIYKWKAAYCFQQHWNPDAEDFAAMLESCFPKSSNLIAGPSWFPVRMLNIFAGNDPKSVRSAMLALFDESQPLRDRMVAFADRSAGWLEAENAGRAARGEGSAKNHFQDTRSMCVYLAFVNPEHNYLYKSEMYRTFARLLGLTAPGDKFDRAIAYKELCDAVLQYLEANWGELIVRSDELLAPEFQDADPAHHMLAQDIVYYAVAYMPDEEQDDLPLDNAPKTWMYAPGENAWAWDECTEQGIMVLGWDRIGDFAQYPTREAITDALKKAYEDDSSKVMASLACWQFQNEIKPGDIVYAKRGLYAIIGKGVVKSVSRYEPERERYTQVRDVEWVVLGDWDIRDAAIPMDNGEIMKTLPMKTLTEWTMYPDAVEAVEKLISKGDISPKQEYDPYDDKAFLEDVFMDADDLAELKGLLKRKKNIILQGAPGTGKTFAAKRLAWALMGCKDTSRIQQVQFHQSTTYDDFVYGYRPNAEGGFEPVPGTFVEFCRKASLRPNVDFFFIIDEINRANISKVFGELLMLIEADHRGESVVFPVSGERFCVPANVYIIGMMNTADRGLALIDYALRRRFAFFEMKPALENERFESQAALSGEKMASLVYAVVKLNEATEEETSLGRGFRIGHSYFCPDADGNPVDPASVVKYELVPLIEEYWFDDEKRAHTEIDKLKAAVE